MKTVPMRGKKRRASEPTMPSIKRKIVSTTISNVDAMVMRSEGTTRLSVVRKTSHERNAADVNANATRAAVNTCGYDSLKDKGSPSELTIPRMTACSPPMPCNVSQLSPNHEIGEIGGEGVYMFVFIRVFTLHASRFTHPAPRPFKKPRNLF